MATESDIVGKSKELIAAVNKRDGLKAKYDDAENLYHKLVSTQKKIASAKLTFTKSGWIAWEDIPHICYMEVQGEFTKFSIEDLNHINCRGEHEGDNRRKQEIKNQVVARERTFERQMKAQHAMIEAFLPYLAEEIEDYRLEWQSAVMEVDHLLSEWLEGSFNA